MKKLALCLILPIFLPLISFSQTNPDPLTVSNLTQTSADVSWNAVSGATSYSVWNQCIDGSYGFQFCKLATVTDTIYHFTGLNPATTENVCVTSNANSCPVGSGPGQTSFTTYQQPWISPISPTTYTINGGYVGSFTYGGAPAPTVTLLDAPSDMWLRWQMGGQSDSVVLWNAQSTTGVTFTLQIVNNQGSASQTITLVPDGNPPVDPPTPPRRVNETLLSGTTFQWALQSFPRVYAMYVYVKQPGGDWGRDWSGAPTQVSPGIYQKTFTNFTASGQYSVQIQVTATRSDSGTFSNPVTVTIP